MTETIFSARCTEEIAEAIFHVLDERFTFDFTKTKIGDKFYIGCEFNCSNKETMRDRVQEYASGAYAALTYKPPT